MAGVRRSTDLNSSLPPPTQCGIGPIRADAPRPVQSVQPAAQGNLTMTARGSWMVVAAVIAIMAFQAVMSPPGGGVWQGNAGSDEAGEAVLSKNHPDNYLVFLCVNTTSFCASVCVLLLLITGFDLRCQCGTWLLTSAMCIAVTFMAFNYVFALCLVTPDPVLVRFCRLGVILVCTFNALIAIVVVIDILCKRIKKLCNFNFIRKSTTRRAPAEDHSANV
jgi:hypothetical protein